MSERVRIAVVKEGGKMTPATREVMGRAWDGLPDGSYEITFNRNGYQWTGRYRYYFGYLMTEIIRALNLVVVDKCTGEVRAMLTEELHGLCKERFNKVRVKDPFTRRWKERGGSTTGLEDGDFITKYEEEICAHFAVEYGIELLSRDEWKEKRKHERAD